MLSVLSWNIQQGGGSRAWAITQNLLASKAHILVLSEFHNQKDNKIIEQSLAQQGYIYQYFTQATGHNNTVFIASQLPGIQQLYPEADLGFSQNIQALRFSALGVMGVYLPHKKKHNLLPFLTETLAADTLPFIITGDYNTGHNYIDQKGDSFWYTDQLKALEASGYTDAFRYVHGAVETYSWYSHQGNGYRYDHTYVHQSLLPLVKDCYYLQDWRLQKLSDHAPMLLHLG
jgi:exodeoxyribonuclease III